MKYTLTFDSPGTNCPWEWSNLQIKKVRETNKEKISQSVFSEKVLLRFMSEGKKVYTPEWVKDNKVAPITEKSK